MRIRLTFPARFRTERAANGFIRDNSLWSIGAQAVAIENQEYRVVIDTSRADAVQRYLAQGGPLPGVEWARSDLP